MRRKEAMRRRSQQLALSSSPDVPHGFALNYEGRVMRFAQPGDGIRLERLRKTPTRSYAAAQIRLFAIIPGEQKPDHSVRQRPENVTNCRVSRHYPVSFGLRKFSKDVLYLFTPVPQPGKTHLSRLLLLRGIVLGGAAVAAIFAERNMGAAFPLPPLLIALGAMALLNLATWLRLRWASSVSDKEFLLQVAADVVGLTVVLYFAGGAANPFTLLYLLPVSLMVAALPQRRYVWGTVLLATLCYTGLLVVSPTLHGGGVHIKGAFDLHAFGMWLGFVVSSCLIAFFALSMQEQLRERDRILGEIRDKQTRDQRLVELGTLAAGAAHELGTPLATMAVVASELEDQFRDDPDVAARARLIRDQIRRCKRSLSVLSANAGQATAASGDIQPLDEFLRALITEWRGSRSSALGVRVDLDGTRPVPTVICDRTISQAIVNILNNAADVSPQGVEIEGRWDAQTLLLEIRDRGPGFATHTSRQGGSALFTSKADTGGLGIGLLLAYSTISRLGGRVDVYSRAGGGTTTRIGLDLSKLVVDRAGQIHGRSAVDRNHEQPAFIAGG